MKRGWGWLVLAVALVLLGAYLIPDKAGPKAVRAPVVEFPRPTAQSVKRAKERTTVLRRIIDVTPRDPSTPVTVDPVLASLTTDRPVVIEASAILHSPVGEMLLACWANDETGDLDTFEALTGLDVRRDLDRIAFSGGGAAVASGTFGALSERLASTPGASSSLYGEAGEIFAPAGDRSTFVGVWRSELAVVGPRHAVEATLDRIEGRSDDVLALQPDQAYGDVYGRITPEFLTELLPVDASLQAMIRDRVDDAELHLDASADVTMTLDVRGDDAAAIDELGRALGAALAVARIQARVSGDETMEELLEHARVGQRFDGRFRVELAVTQEFLQRQLADCGRPRAGRPLPP